MFYFHKDIIKGMRRRFKEVRLLATVTLISVMFITASLMFQINSETYLFEVNRVRYGNWVIAESIDDTDKYKQVFKGHSYFEKWGTAVCGLEVTNDSGNSTIADMGYIDDDLVEIGHIKLKEGRFPENIGEIAVPSDVLVSLGYSLELGQKITLNIRGADIMQVAKEYELVGVLDNSMSNWCVSGSMPSVLVTKEEADTLNYKEKVRYFYELKEEYRDIDTGEFYDNLVGDRGVSEDGMWSVSYNDYLYSTSFWGEPRLYTWVECMLLLSGMAALSFCMITYIQSRKKNYYCLRVIGMSKLQTKLVILMENVTVCLPAGLIAMFGTLLIGLGISAVLTAINGIESFYVVPVDTFLKILLSWLLIIIVSVVIAIMLTGQKQLYGNTKSVSIGGLKRRFLNKLKSGRVYSSIYKREQKVYSIRYGISVAISLVIASLLLYSGSKMWEAWREYNIIIGRLSDFECRNVSGSGPVSEGTYVWYMDAGDGPKIGLVSDYSYGGIRCTEGFNESFYEKFEDIKGIKNYYVSTFDNSHLFEWDNMMEDSYIKNHLNEYNGYTGWKDKDDNLVMDYYYWYEIIEGNTLHFGYNSWFVSDVKEKYEYYNKKCNSDTMTYEGFESGEQVFVILNRESDYLNEGSTFRILAGDEAITVQIGAVVPMEKLKDGDYYGNSVDESGRRMGINIIGSKALAEKIAKAEGGQVKNNLIDINLSAFARYGITVKQCAKLLSDEGIACHDWSEGKRGLFDKMFTEVTMYGVFSIILVMFYMILKSNMVQSGIVTSGNRIKRFRMLGMSKAQVSRMYILQGVNESKLLVVILPFIYLFHLYLMYDELKGNHLRMHPERFYVEELNEYVIHLEDIMRYTIEDHVNLFISIALIALIMIINVFARYVVVKRYLKQSGGFI